MIYINRTVKGYYVELSSALDEKSNLIGTTWEDFKNEYWILLSDEQIAFKNDNPDASIKEVFMMKLDEKPVVDEEKIALDNAKRDKLREIEEQDERSNLFYIDVIKGGELIAHQSLWIDKDLRNSLYSITLPALKAKGEATTKLWTTDKPPVSIEVPIDWAMEKLPELEVYAKQTYDKKAENEAAVYSAYENKDLNALMEVDVYLGYPLVKTFELNLDLNE